MRPAPAATSLLSQEEIQGQDGPLTPPNFITECFFLVHILISFGSKKLEQFYMRNNDQLSQAFNNKDYAQFDEFMAQKIAMDAHLFGKATLSLYRSLFTFTGALLICAGEDAKLSDNVFADGLFSFMNVGVNPRTEFNPIADGEIPEDKRLAWDFLALPQLIIENMNSYPKLFKMIEP